MLRHWHSKKKYNFIFPFIYRDRNRIRTCSYRLYISCNVWMAVNEHDMLILVGSGTICGRSLHSSLQIILEVELYLNRKGKKSEAWSHIFLNFGVGNAMKCCQIRYDIRVKKNKPNRIIKKLQTHEMRYVSGISTGWHGILVKQSTVCGGSAAAYSAPVEFQQRRHHWPWSALVQNLVKMEPRRMDICMFAVLTCYCWALRWRQSSEP